MLAASTTTRARIRARLRGADRVGHGRGHQQVGVEREPVGARPLLRRPRQCGAVDRAVRSRAAAAPRRPGRPGWRWPCGRRPRPRDAGAGEERAVAPPIVPKPWTTAPASRAVERPARSSAVSTASATPQPPPSSPRPMPSTSTANAAAAAPPASASSSRSSTASIVEPRPASAAAASIVVLAQTESSPVAQWRSMHGRIARGSGAGRRRAPRVIRVAVDPALGAAERAVAVGRGRSAAPPSGSCRARGRRPRRACSRRASAVRRRCRRRSGGRSRGSRACPVTGSCQVTAMYGGRVIPPAPRSASARARRAPRRRRR